MRSLLWYYDKFKPEVSQQCREIFHPPKEVQTRQLYAFTPEAPQKIDSYLKENHASDLQELKALDDQIAKSRWPQFTFAYRAYQIIQRFSEKLADHWEKLEAQLLSKPEDMDVKFIQGLQNKSQRTQLKIKEAIAQLKQNAGGNSNALLTRLAQDSLKKGQIDTIPLLKAAGADAEVIDKEAAKQGIHL